MNADACQMRETLDGIAKQLQPFVTKETVACATCGCCRVFFSLISEVRSFDDVVYDVSDYESEIPMYNRLKPVRSRFKDAI